MRHDLGASQSTRLTVWRKVATGGQMLLIITPAEFLPNLAALKKHKESTGMPTTVVTLESIQSSRLSGDIAEKVKRTIAKFYTTSMCRFVLLVGDSDKMPVRFTRTDRADCNSFNTAFYPTDLYYACLFRPGGSFDTWDTNGDGYYGELRGETGTGPINAEGVSLVPHVAVGRIPASAGVEVDRYVAKAISYEVNAFQQDWPWRALLVSTHDWENDASSIHLRLAETCMFHYSTTLVTTRGRHGNDAVVSTAISTAVDRGVGVIGYMGHGADAGLAIPTGWWGTGDVDALTNTDRFPVVLADACSTAEFATLPPYEPYTDVNGLVHVGSAHGEHFAACPPQPHPLQILHDPDSDLGTRLTVGTSGGSVAYFGGATGMQRHEPVTYLLEEMVTATTLGEAWRRMIARYYATFDPGRVLTAPDWFAVATVHQPWKYMLFGDPSLRIRGARPGDPTQYVALAA